MTGQPKAGVMGWLQRCVTVLRQLGGLAGAAVSLLCHVPDPEVLEVQQSLV